MRKKRGRAPKIKETIDDASVEKRDIQYFFQFSDLLLNFPGLFRSTFWISQWKNKFALGYLKDELNNFERGGWRMGENDREKMEAFRGTSDGEDSEDREEEIEMESEGETEGGSEGEMDL